MTRLTKKIFHLVKNIFILFMIISIFSVLCFKFVNPPGTMLMLEQKIMHWDAPQDRIWVNYDEISDAIKVAVIAAEDQNFVNHYGFDVQAIKQAILHNQHNDTLQGASTITQQVAKNLYLWPSRSLLRKGFELWFTLWIELFWSKQRILEIYLNSVEWDNGIFGVEAAAQHYFHTSANKLTLKQASLLAAILPNPRKLNPIYPSEKIKNKANWIQQQCQNLGGKNYLKKIESP